MKIMTGAPVPENADAIVPYENTDRGENDVKITGRARSDNTSAGSGRTSRPASGCSSRAISSAPATSACWPASDWTRCWSGRARGSW